MIACAVIPHRNSAAVTVIFTVDLSKQGSVFSKHWIHKPIFIRSCCTLDSLPNLLFWIYIYLLLYKASVIWTKRHCHACLCIYKSEISVINIIKYPLLIICSRTFICCGYFRIIQWKNLTIIEIRQFIYPFIESTAALIKNYKSIYNTPIAAGFCKLKCMWAICKSAYFHNSQSSITGRILYFTYINFIIVRAVNCCRNNSAIFLKYNLYSGTAKFNI